MPLQTSGAISFSEIQDELGGSNPISMTEYYGEDGLPTSGSISAANFYGKEAAFATIRRVLNYNTSGTISVDTTVDASGTEGKTWAVALWRWGGAGGAPNPGNPVVNGTTLTSRAYRSSYYDDDGSAIEVWCEPITPNASATVTWSGAGGSGYANSNGFQLYIVNGVNDDVTPFVYSAVGNLVSSPYTYNGSGNYCAFGAGARSKGSGSLNNSDVGNYEFDTDLVTYGLGADKLGQDSTTYYVSAQTFGFIALSYGDNRPIGA